MERVVSRRTTFVQALADFELKLNECTTKAVDGRSFVLVEKLQVWMRDTNTSNKLENRFVTNTDLLAHAAYFNKSKFIPVEPSTVADRGPECCVLVFSILLDLQLGHLLHFFARAGVLDRFPLKEKDQIAELFDKRQWKFCPAFFSMHMDKQFFENRIIPIVVQAEFVDQKLRKLLEDDEHASYTDKDYGPCYLFALKTFKDGYFQYFEDEKTAFDGLRKVPGVIRRLGCYSHRSPVAPAVEADHDTREHPSAQGTTTMNLLLEYGTYDLRLIFGHITPPVFPTETIAFWENLFEVANAVSGIHEFKHGGSEFNGWHADIKPENIIFVRGKYKLADPGFACFKKKAQDKGTAPQICLHGGTDTYGAPEVYRANVHQTIDTWSLGCVFSMAATWVVLGYQGVYQYQLVREKALEGLLDTIEDDNHPLLQFLQVPASAKPEKVDCFHNGTEVLREVTGWHSLLKNSSRKSDPITAEVIDVIGSHMLIQDPEERTTSQALCTKLKGIVTLAKKILNKAQTDESLELRTERQHMEDLLKGIDKEAAPHVTEEPTRVLTPPFAAGLPVNRSALKAHMSNLTLKKTSHRFETIPESRSGPISPGTFTGLPTIVASEPKHDNGMFYRPRTPPEPVITPPQDKRRSARHSTSWRPSRQSTFGQPSRSNTGISLLTYQTTGPGPRPRATQNVIQAREGIERDRKRAPLGVPLRKKKPTKDEFLSKHFIDRDIKFLVDDAESMSEHWDVATYLLETLVLKAHDQDPDGPDLAFTNDKKPRKEKNAAEFRKAMQEVRPCPDSGVHTNIKVALEKIFGDYISVARRTNNKLYVRALTVIILTDGLWEGMDDRDEIITEIVQFYKKLETAMKNEVRHRQVTIQFIQLGDDEEARERLRRLDDDTPYRGIPDIIDYEQFTIGGDIDKMLLGSFVEEMDAKNSEDGGLSSPGDSSPSRSPGSPPANGMTLRSIEEAIHDELPSPAAQMYEMPGSRPMR